MSNSTEKKAQAPKKEKNTPAKLKELKATEVAEVAGGKCCKPKKMHKGSKLTRDGWQ